MTSKPFVASLLACALFAGLGMSSAMAQSATQTPGIDRTQQQISARIQQGLASGHITPFEAQVLYRHDRDIAQRENQYKADRNASPQERQRLRAELASLSAEVERMMNNRDVVRQPVRASNTPGIDRLEFQIERRIEDGVRSGRITQDEARRLSSRDREIDRLEARFKADGVLAPQERQQLRSELTALRDEVERMTHNDRHGRNDRHDRNDHDRRGRG